MKKLFRPLSVFLFLFAATGCYREYYRGDRVVDGYQPIYSDKSRSEVSFKASTGTLNNPGKIYIYNQYLLVNEVNAGIHVFDNSNPTAPIDLGFIEMLGNSDMAIRNDILYADHAGDLISLPFKQFETAKPAARLPINSWILGVPPPRFSSFECVNEDLGYVIGWKKVTLTNPDCYAY
jgi:hypothetical protein